MLSGAPEAVRSSLVGAAERLPLFNCLISVDSLLVLQYT